MMMWNGLKLPIALAAAVAACGIGIGVASSAGQGPAPQRKQAPKPGVPQPKSREAPPQPKSREAPPRRDPTPRPPVGTSPFGVDAEFGEGPPPPPDGENPLDEGQGPGQVPFPSDNLRNLPKGTLPEFVEEDTAEKIQAAQERYDGDIDQFARESTERRAAVESSNVQVDAIKRRMAKVADELLLQSSYRHEDLDDEGSKRLQRGLNGLKEESLKLRYDLVNAIREAEDARSRQEAAVHQLQDLRRRPRPVERIEVRPGDIIRVEILEALPGRPISGERFVQADGRIALEFYGTLFVSGLTTEEIKEKVILKMRKFIDDSTLGLLVVDPETGEPRTIMPKDSDRVFVEILISR